MNAQIAKSMLKQIINQRGLVSTLSQVAALCEESAGVGPITCDGIRQAAQATAYRTANIDLDGNHLQYEEFGPCHRTSD